MKQNHVGVAVRHIGFGILCLILVTINLGCGFLYVVFDAMTDPRGTMAAREEKIRKNVIPELLERNVLNKKTFRVFLNVFYLLRHQA